MKYLLDTNNIEKIKLINDYFPLEGVTTNPSILANSSQNPMKQLKAIRSIIGDSKILHVQVTTSDANLMLKEANNIKTIGGNISIKVPISKNGLKGIKLLKKHGFQVTATAIFTSQQAVIAARAGADFVAPYVNRLDNLSIDGAGIVREIVKIFKSYEFKTQVLAASFKNVQQVQKVCIYNTHLVTVKPNLLEKLINHPRTLSSIQEFNEDWHKTYGDTSIYEY